MEHIGLYLKEIFLNNKRGQLIFRHGGVQKYMFFHKGSLVSAKTNQHQELLGEVLYKLGKIKEDVYSNIEQYIQPKKRLGEELIKHALISENDLREGLSFQMREILLNTFSAFEAEFKFQERDDLSDQEFETKINIPLLIEDGVRRMKYDQAIKVFFESKQSLPKSKSFFYRLTEEEKEILEAIRGDSSNATVLEKSRFNSEIFWKSLFLFFCLDLIDISDDGKKVESKDPANGKKVESKDPVKQTNIGDMEKNVADALALSGNLSSLDHYQLLEVETSADQAEIKRNYFRLARKFHPDLYGRDLPHEIKVMIEGVFDQVSKAYQTLSDEKKRKIYDERKEKIPVEDKRNWPKVAEVKFRQGKTLYDKKQYQEAIIFLEEAVKLQGKKGQYFLLLALAQSKIPALHRKSETNFIHSIRYEPWNAEGYVGLGMLYKREGLEKKKKNKFEKALSIDPAHKLAQREMNGLAENKKKTLKDFFSIDLFGKKK